MKELLGILAGERRFPSELNHCAPAAVLTVGGGNFAYTENGKEVKHRVTEVPDLVAAANQISQPVTKTTVI